MKTEKTIKPKDAYDIVEQWRLSPTKCNRDNVFYLCIEASKAVIGKLQRSYNMKVKDYDGKVLDCAIKLMDVLDSKADLIPKNFVSWSYLYVLGLIFHKKMVQMDKELLLDDLIIDSSNIQIEMGGPMPHIYIDEYTNGEKCL